MLNYKFHIRTALGKDIWTVTNWERNIVQVMADDREQAQEKAWEKLDLMYAGNESVISHSIEGVEQW